MKKKSIWPKAMLAIATGASLAASMILAPPAFAVSEQASTASDEGVYADADILQALLFAEGPAAKKLGMTELQSGEAYDTATREVTEDYLEGHAEVLAPILAELRSGEVLEVDQALQALTADFLPYLEEMPGVESPGEVQPAAYDELPAPNQERPLEIGRQGLPTELL